MAVREVGSSSDRCRGTAVVGFLSDLVTFSDLAGAPDRPINVRIGLKTRVPLRGFLAPDFSKLVL